MPESEDSDSIEVVEIIKTAPNSDQILFDDHKENGLEFDQIENKESLDAPMIIHGYAQMRDDDKLNGFVTTKGPENDNEQFAEEKVEQFYDEYDDEQMVEHDEEQMIEHDEYDENIIKSPMVLRGYSQMVESDEDPLDGYITSQRIDEQQPNYMPSTNMNNMPPPPNPHKKKRRKTEEQEGNGYVEDDDDDDDEVMIGITRE